MIAVGLAITALLLLAVLAADAWARRAEISKAEAYREWRRAMGL